MHEAVRHRGEGEVGLWSRDAGSDRAFRVEGRQAKLHQRVRSRDVGRRPLNHRHLSADLPERRADVVRGIVGADDDHLLAPVRIGSGVLGGVVLLAFEDVHALELGEVRFPRHAGGEHQLFRPQRHLDTVAPDDNRPLLGVFVVGGLEALGGAPIVELHHRRVHLQPVGDLVFR